MHFIAPQFLYAFLALSIPVIVHLFNFRRFKKVFFTNVRFLKEVKQETQSRSRLRHLLVLLCRMLVLAALVMAFAQPYIPAGAQKVNAGEKAISIYVDNSFSMDATNKSGHLLDEARKNAREIVAAFSPADRFQLLTNDFEGRHQRFVSKDEFLQLLEGVKLSAAVKPLSAIVSRQLDLLNDKDLTDARQKKAFLLSDFQKSIVDLEQLRNDTSVSFQLVPIEAQERDNVYVDSCWFETPVRQTNKVEKLHVRLINASDKRRENIPVKLFINNVQKSPASFSMAAHQVLDTVMSFSTQVPGIQHARIEISDYPVSFDDHFYFSFQVLNAISVLNVLPTNATSASKEDYIYRLFKTDSAFRYASFSENNIDYGMLAHQDLIVLSELHSISSGLAQELKKFIDNGGSLVVFPAEDADLPSYNELLSSMQLSGYEALDTTNTKVAAINFLHPLYQGVFEKKKDDNVDLPVVFSHYRLAQISKSNQQALMTLQNADVFFASYRAGSGKVYISSVPLNTEASNFVKHAVFVPTLFQIALFSQPQQPLFYTSGKNQAVDVGLVPNNGEDVLHVVSTDKKIDLIPEHRVSDGRTMIFVHDQLKSAGNFSVMAAKNELAGISFNYDRKESDLSCYTSDRLSAAITDKGWNNFRLLSNERQNLTIALAEIDQGIKLWKWFVIMALVFLLIEIVLLRIGNIRKTGDKLAAVSI